MNVRVIDLTELFEEKGIDPARIEDYKLGEDGKLAVQGPDHWMRMSE